MPEPRRGFGVADSSGTTSAWLDAKISEDKETEEFSISSLLSTVGSAGPPFGSPRPLGETLNTSRYPNVPCAYVI